MRLMAGEKRDEDDENANGGEEIEKKKPLRSKDI